MGNGTAHFEFLYTVQPGDHSINLEYWDINAFKTDGFVRRAGEQVGSFLSCLCEESLSFIGTNASRLGRNVHLFIGLSE